MTLTIHKAIEKQKTGYHIGNRLIFPFRCHILKVIIENEIFTDFSTHRGITIQHDAKNTSLYFHSLNKLENLTGKYKALKLIITEWESDLCDRDNHIKIVCEIDNNRKVNIFHPDEDLLFIE